MVYKVVAIVGVFLGLLGAVLLTRASPSGYALGAYANDAILQQVAVQNRRMQRRQRLAIVLIVVGALLQVPCILFA